MIRSLVRCMIFLIALSLIIIQFAGCAGVCKMSIPGYDVEKVKEMPAKEDTAAAMKKPTLLADISWHSKLWPHKARQLKIPASFHGSFIEAAHEANLFDTVITDADAQRTADYKMELDMLNHGNLLGALCSGTISGISLLIIPGYARDNYTLTAKLYHDNRLVKTYTYKDHITTWYQVLLFPAYPFTKNAGDNLRKNMLRRMFADMITDRIINSRATVREEVMEGSPLHSADNAVFRQSNTPR